MKPKPKCYIHTTDWLNITCNVCGYDWKIREGNKNSIWERRTKNYWPDFVVGLKQNQNTKKATATCSDCQKKAVLLKEEND